MPPSDLSGLTCLFQLFLLWAIGGALTAAGVVAFSPRSSSHTRKDIQRKKSETQQGIDQASKDYVQDVTTVYRSAMRRR